MTVKIQGFTDFAVKQDSIDFSRLLFFYNDMFTNLVIVIISLILSAVFNPSTIIA